ncbi:hypothetical protein F2Q68_00016429 [Brassica cretica]|uniref:Uncharacterized protein n=1 Tax=Brassica cretica TaxID=69181 RepID=A0A8S9HDW1_BRACR|nr:hypothetical protein F2Q68_00016429 [Brassica cretica]
MPRSPPQGPRNPSDREPGEYSNTQSDPNNNFSSKDCNEPTNNAFAISPDSKGNAPREETASPVRVQERVPSILQFLFARENMTDELSQTNKPQYLAQPEETFIEV